jgi:hypothetical protein
VSNRFLVAPMVIALCVAGCLGMPAQRPDTCPSTLRSLFEYAQNRRTADLLACEGAIAASSDVKLSTAFPMALYVADPQRFTLRFVEAFPTSYGELMFGVYEIELAGVLREPAFFTVRTLGRLAQGGNSIAARKLLLGAPHTDGVMAEAFLEELGALLEKRPGVFAKAFSFLTEAERTSVLGGLRGVLDRAHGREIAVSIRGLRDLSPEEKATADMLIRSLEESR